MATSNLFQKFLTTGRTKLLLITLVVFALGAVGIIAPRVSAAPARIDGVKGAATVPSNFTRVTLISNLANPVQTRFAPNGDIYIAEQCGTIRLYHNGALVATPVIAIPNTMCDNERGLLGIALDGNFATNGYLYAGYTNTDGHSRLSRFTVVNGVANPTSETILYEFTPPSAIYHNINDVEWGPDGKLWVESGDGYTCGSACGTEAQNLSSPFGKLLRFNPDGSAPTDNPFYGQPAPQSYVWAMGFRSNYRMTFMANGTPMVGDVGDHTPVEDKWQRFYMIAKPNGQNISNEGWSSFEYHAPCTSPANANANPNNGETNCPFYEYQNNPSPSASNAITGFQQYEGNAYPASYKDALFYSEYGSQTIHYLTFTDSTFTQVASDTIFDDAASTTVDLEVGPDGDLYSTAIYANAVYKYVYTPSTGTPTPTPIGGPLQLSNLNVSDTANSANWSIQQNIQVGDTQFGDRGYTLTSLPSSLAGSTWIRTANGSKTFTANPTAAFDINQPATIYVAIDNRLPKPSWMDASWVNTGLTMTNTEATPPFTQTLFAKAFPAGTVSLGPVSNNPSNTFLMYTVIAAPGGTPATPTPTATTGPATPTPTTAPGTPTPTPTTGPTATTGPATPTPTPVTGGPVQLSNLTVADTANAANWSLQTNLQVGAVQYGDRGYAFATLPTPLVGSAWVRTAMGSKAYTGNPTVTFTIDQQATVYVVLDTRITPPPSWLDGTWTLTSLSVTDNQAAGHNAFVVYSKTFPAGSVALGENNNGSTVTNMYSVAVVGTGSGSTPTPTATTAPTATTGPATPTATAVPGTPTPTATTAPTATPTGSAVQLSNLTVADTAHATGWSLQTNLQVGAVQYGDRGYTFATVPTTLAGAAWVRTAMASKAYTGNPTVTFTINQQATVYVVLDSRLPKPSWMDATWTLTTLTATDNQSAGSNAFVVYSKTFPAGSVALGPNDNGSTNGVNMYTVIVQ